MSNNINEELQGLVIDLEEQHADLLTISEEIEQLEAERDALQVELLDLKRKYQGLAMVEPAATPESDTETVTFVPVTSIVPESWEEWFYDKISANAPFTWGDNNRTLVTASRFAIHVQGVFAYELIPYDESVREFFAKLTELGETYIDLEN